MVKLVIQHETNLGVCLTNALIISVESIVMMASQCCVEALVREYHIYQMECYGWQGAAMSNRAGHCSSCSITGNGRRTALSLWTGNQ